MRPAYSVILFTTLSGAGYGLLAVLGALLLLGTPPGRPSAALGLGLTLASVGLVASTFHLGRPERAWRAFSQWRTSWLSREGVAALAVYAVALPLCLLLLWPTSDAWVVRVLAGAMTALAAATVWCTAMIYASLKPIPQWRHPIVPWAYLLMAAASGTLALDAVQLLPGSGPRGLAFATLAALAGAWATKEVYWRAVDGPAGLPSVASATGLTAGADVRLLDPPHTESNYLLHEMGYRVARRHARRLRNVARILAFAVPFVVTGIATMATGHPTLQGGLALVAALAALVGLLVERWLFFAEARHIVSLYYHGAI